ncbi:RNA-binding protein [Candidatus Woesearchaeota archaeon]|nr:RNA-binding protein [Candidatus Woesearchaeota archaeon]HIH38424.1 RNA-binding protein [Candidatus Woesearchaeota archaeon]HIH48117.1 RNA-binding protein [Candidatus Woesearchaeota archaeon]HIJ03437.1 RNA-binding protein [Candidatus Woesearchaeota archaeon]
MEKEFICISSKQKVANDRSAVVFPCPGCGEQIVRSKTARMLASPYKCQKCGFEGPN